MPETRTTTTSTKAPPTTSADGQVQDSPPPHPGEKAFRSLVDQANHGDKAALQRLRLTLDDNPQIWQRVGDLAAHARLTLSRLIADGDKLLFESIERMAAEMEAELLGPAPTPLERLAVQRVVACWLQLQYADTVSSTRTETLAQMKFWAKQQDRAHRRYQAAVRQLLVVRQATWKPSTAENDSFGLPKEDDATVKNPAPKGARR